MAGNTTFISGVDDEKVDDVIGIIAKYSNRRTQIVPSTSTMDVGMYSSFPVEVTVGGSTIFVMNVDRFRKGIMDFFWFLGNEEVKEALSAAFKASGVFPMQFFCRGENGCKRTLAKLLAKALVCREKERVPCGTCPSCIPR